MTAKSSPDPLLRAATSTIGRSPRLEGCFAETAGFAATILLYAACKGRTHPAVEKFHATADWVEVVAPGTEATNLRIESTAQGRSLPP